MSSSHNIVFFGESGVGKSSVINMLCEDEVAETSSGADQCTLDAQAFDGVIKGENFTFWDTVGLRAGDTAKAPGLKEAASLYRLLYGLKDGFSLLVLVMRAPRITDPAKKNWKLFQDIICQRNVPVVVVVTNLEQQNLDTWWMTNATYFTECEMCPSTKVHRTYGTNGIRADGGAACITATKGKRYKQTQDFIFQEEYDISCKKLRRLIYEAYLPSPWKLPRVEWYKKIVEDVGAMFGCINRAGTHRARLEGRIRALVSTWNLTNDEAKVVVGALEAALK